MGREALWADFSGSNVYFFKKIYNGLSINPMILDKMAQKPLNQAENTFDFCRKEY